MEMERVTFVIRTTPNAAAVPVVVIPSLPVRRNADLKVLMILSYVILKAGPYRLCLFCFGTGNRIVFDEVRLCFNREVV